MAISAPKAPKNLKPKSCVGCSLHERGHGFVQPSGPENAPILFLGEAPGYDEAATGIPFIGAAGSMLERILRRNNQQRASFRVGNVLSCVPPGLELRGASYELSAIDHCAVHRNKVLAEPHKVIMALGATPLKTLLGLHGRSRVRVEEFHGTVHQLESGQYVVPSFHPSYLQRGAHNLIGTVSFDLQVALEVARGEWTPEPIDLVLDPPVAWFARWAEDYLAAAAQDPDGIALSCDMETPDKAGGKPENELGPDDTSYQINRWNFACHPDQGVTVPNDPAYLAIVRKLLESAGWKYWWNGSGYDWARCAAANHQLQSRWQLDLMLGAHVLQSDVPLGLGFWAPFYSHYGAWKHLSETDPIQYACIDGPQTQRTGYGIVGDLVAQGQWRAFHDDCHLLYHEALKPAMDVGILIDKPELERFHEDLAVKQRRLLHEIQACVPDELRPLTGETGKAPDEGVLHPNARTHTLKGAPLKNAPDPLKQALYALSAVRVERLVLRTITVCETCGAQQIAKTHRCKDASGKVDDRVPVIGSAVASVQRWFWQEPFNPDSSPQILAYLKHRKHKAGKDKHTKKDSADRETLKGLLKSTKDPFYDFLLKYKAVKKIDSTYATPTLRRATLDPEGRIRPIPTFRPTTQRLSYQSPNITNIVQDRGGQESLAAGFRRCIVAAPGCRLLEVDYSAIEAVQTGWFSRDPAYIRLAKLGVHAYLASHLLGRPANLAWSDADLSTCFKEIKKAHDETYQRAKRVVHGSAYGLTSYGMSETFPELFPTQQIAEKVQGMFFTLCPTVPTWHKALQQHAYEKGSLGGPGEMMILPDNSCYTDKKYSGPSPFNHPFQYRHWFWSVLAYKPITEKQRQWREKRKRLCVEIQGRWFSVDKGEDAKRCIAFLPQSTAAGVLKRAMLALFADRDSPSYIGDAYFGRTPFRAPIHDSLLFEVPDRQWDRVCEAVFREMLRPVEEQPLPAAWKLGSHLTIGVEAKAGRNWLDLEGVAVPGLGDLGLAGDETIWPVEESDEETFAEMGVVA